MKWEHRIGDARITIESNEVHEVLIETWFHQIMNAWRILSSACPAKTTVKSRATLVPRLTAGGQDYKLIRNWIEGKLAPPWDEEPTAKDRTAVRKFVKTLTKSTRESTNRA